MEHTKTLEERLLGPALLLLDRLSNGSKIPNETRLQLLEATASKIGGFALARYQKIFNVEPLSTLRIGEGAELIAAELSKLAIPPALALAALARPSQESVEQKRAGSFNTDWRLASLIASNLSNSGRGLVLDPACGTGALLVAAALQQAGHDQKLRREFLAERACGTDLDPRAIRGATLALASLTSDVGALRALADRLRVADALVTPEHTWSDLLVRGQLRFDAVVGNPPWERLRLTRHEHLAASGLATHYGDLITDNAVAKAGKLDRHKRKLSKYRRALDEDFTLQGRGEADLYKLFTELALRVLEDEGQLSWLLPGGIIRSHGSTNLRKTLLDRCSHIQMTVFSNLGRFFAVYRRQKFVHVEARVGHGTRHPLQLRHAQGTADSIEIGQAIPLGRASLHQLRSDVAVPEVRTQTAWNLFLHLSKSGLRVRDWHPALLREVDMSLDRSGFLSKPRPGAVPIIEGRMVHQYTHDAKRYVSGTGRAAKWDMPSKGDVCKPSGQYWIPTDNLSAAVQTRIRQERVGFCDVTGQTNERGMLCAPIPAGFVCGNKVPTILFEGLGDPISAGHAFTAIANSFVFDWVVRRMISTSVNFFLLLDLPWPRIDPDSLVARRLAKLARDLGGCRHSVHVDQSKFTCVQDCRLAIEVIVAEAWGVSFTAMHEVFDDFPLLDGGSPALPGDRRSTITRDLVLLRIGEREGAPERHLADLRQRVALARSLGATPFIPTQFAGEEASDERAAL